jgi:hypothetical protein
LSTLLVIKDMGRVPKRLKTGDKPIVAAVKVEVESNNNKEEEEEEEESLDNDDDEEEEDEEQEGQVKQPVARGYVPPRRKYILMDYDKSMGDGVIPNNKVLRPKNCWCYTILHPVFWGENSIDRCPTYGVCQVCCSSGPTGRYCQICKNEDVIYVCMVILLKNDKGEKISRMVDAQWILRIFEATQIDA